MAMACTSDRSPIQVSATDAATMKTATPMTVARPANPTAAETTSVNKGVWPQTPYLQNYRAGRSSFSQ